MTRGPALSRRGLLRAAPSLAALLPAAARALDLPAVPYATRASDTVAPGYARDVLVRWGDRVTFDARPWTPRNPTPEAAETQFGWDGRIVGLFAPPAGADGVPRGILAVAHPTVDPAMAFPGGLDRPEVAAAMQGASLLNVERQRDRWIVADGGYQSRRLTANTLCRVAGPAAGALGGSVRGLLAVSGGCWTPWGSLLLAEDDPGAWTTRLRGWDSRFADPRGFGWVAELDGTEPGSVPAKRTALGRFAHGDAAAALTRDGRAVVYMTDRRPGGFLLRFLSAGPAHAADALDAGTLAVARIEEASLTWVDLPRGPVALTETAALAARAGGTGFPHPSGLDVDGRDGFLLLACRGQPGASPPAPGQVLQITPRGGDHGADQAVLSVLVRGGPPGLVGGGPPPGSVGGGPPPGSVGGGPPPGAAWPEHPDTVTADGAGRAWIGTDRGGRIGPAPDMLFGCETGGPARGMPLALYAAPRGAAVGGSAVSPSGEAIFAMVRTPGAEPGASWARPGTLWPGFDPATPPRSTLVTFSRLRGGSVGG